MNLFKATNRSPQQDESTARSGSLRWKVELIKLFLLPFLPSFHKLSALLPHPYLALLDLEWPSRTTLISPKLVHSTTKPTFTCPPPLTLSPSLSTSKRPNSTPSSFVRFRIPLKRRRSEQSSQRCSEWRMQSRRCSNRRREKEE